MDYKKFDETVFIRLDPGEEIVENLLAVCQKEQIKLAAVRGIGAAAETEISFYDIAVQKYLPIPVGGSVEIVSLLGTVTQKEEKLQPHLHIMVAGEDGAVLGGHLDRAVISVTCELVVDISQGYIERTRREDTGLYLWNFQK